MRSRHRRWEGNRHRRWEGKRGGKGALAAFNGEINAARDVTKTNTYHLQTFRTRDLGLLGYIDPTRSSTTARPIGATP